MQKQQEVYGNIVYILARDNNNLIEGFQQLILLIHLILKQKSQVEQEMVEQKMLK